MAHGAGMTRVVFAACAALLPVLANSAGKPGGREVARAELAGFAVGSGKPALALDVVIADGKLASSIPAGDGKGKLRAVRSGSDAEPMLTVSGELPVAVKFDLYLSQDGERFTYTSSCALTPGISSFEMWQRPVREFALGNPRVVDGKRIRCE